MNTQDVLSNLIDVTETIAAAQSYQLELIAAFRAAEKNGGIIPDEYQVRLEEKIQDAREFLNDAITEAIKEGR